MATLAFKGLLTLFDNNKFDHYSFDEIPLDRDLYIMDVKYIHEYESMMSNFLSDPSLHDYYPVGYVSHVTGRKVLDNSIELSWCANVLDRIHEVLVILPKEQFLGLRGSVWVDIGISG